MTTPRMSVLDPAGPQAAEIASLWSVFYWVSVVVFVVVSGAFVFVTVRAIRNRRRIGDIDPTVRDLDYERRMVRGVAIAGGVTIATLLVLLVMSIRSGSALAALDDDPNALNVRIVAHQWWWEVIYEAHATTANELHVPVGRTVKLELRSGDVIHSFWVPSAHGKKDLIPGRINFTWLRIDEAGVLRGQCAEFCGLQHASMMLPIIAEPPQQFEAWLARQRARARQPTTAEQKRGQRVFTDSACATCHTIAGTSAAGKLGPDLTHVASRRTLGATEAPNSSDNLAGWIVDPQAQKSGARMPATKLPAADLAALLAYLESLR